MTTLQGGAGADGDGRHRGGGDRGGAHGRICAGGPHRYPLTPRHHAQARKLGPWALGIMHRPLIRAHSTLLHVQALPACPVGAACFCRFQ